MSATDGTGSSAVIEAARMSELPNYRLTQFQAFGPSLGVPTSVLQGRFVKLSLLTRF